MKRMGLAASMMLLAACITPTSYTPTYVARAELTLAHDHGMQIYAGRQHLTNGPIYAELEHFVRCVPAAQSHARLASVNGRAGVALAWVGGGFGAVSLGGLAGFAYLPTDKTAAFTLLGTGIAAAVTGLALAIGSRPLRNHAHGHAIDSINYYNDEVGSRGESCDQPAAVVGPASASVEPGDLRPRLIE
jgi:hypothetical protein